MTPVRCAWHEPISPVAAQLISENGGCNESIWPSVDMAERLVGGELGAVFVGQTDRPDLALRL